jgi:hypothetical protein
MTIVSLAAVLLVVLVHLSAGRMQFLERDPWKSMAAGVAISYVFLDILPHLSTMQRALETGGSGGLARYLHNHAYLLALVGFTLFFGQSKIDGASSGQEVLSDEQRPGRMVLYLHMLPLTAYNALIGYLIGEQPDHRYEPVIIFAFAMAIHMAGVDHVVRHSLPRFYDSSLRYLFAAACFAGWLLGGVTNVSDFAFALTFSFIAGAILIVAFVYELPVVAGGRGYFQFAVGVAGFSVLLLVYEALSGVPLAD